MGNIVRISRTNIYVKIEEKEQQLSQDALQAIKFQIDIFAQHYKLTTFSLACGGAEGGIKVNDTEVYTWGRGNVDNGGKWPSLLDFAEILKNFLNYFNAPPLCSICMPTDDDFDSFVDSWRARVNAGEITPVWSVENNNLPNDYLLGASMVANAIGGVSFAGFSVYGLIKQFANDDLPMLPLIIMGSIPAGVCSLYLLYCVSSLAVRKAKHCAQDYCPTLFRRHAPSNDSSNLLLAPLDAGSDDDFEPHLEIGASHH